MKVHTAKNIISKHMRKGILSDFWLMIKILKFGGIISGILGIILLLLGKRYDDTERIKKESL